MAIKETFELLDRMSKPLLTIADAMRTTLNVFENAQRQFSTGLDISGIDEAKKEIESAKKALDSLGTDKTVINPNVSMPTATTPKDTAEVTMPKPETVTPEVETPTITPNINTPKAGADVETPTITPEVGTSTIDNAKKAIDGLGKVNPTISPNVSMADIDNAKRAVDDLGKTSPTVTPKVNDSDLSKTAKEVDNLSKQKPNIDPKVGTESIDNARKAAEDLSNVKPTITPKVDMPSADTITPGTTGTASPSAPASTTPSNNTGNGIKDNFDEASDSGDRLLSKIKSIGAAYLSLQGVKGMLNMSDELAQTTARIDLMNQSFQKVGKSAMSTKQTMDMIYQAAQDSRGSFSDMASVVARFGTNATSAFKDTKELMIFADTIQKQMTLGGASAQEASNAMIQLSQGLSSGTLHGQDLNSVFEQAPNLVQSIADYMNVPIGKIKDMASDGKLTADIVKNAIIASADDVNKKFSELPMTWSELWNTMQNTALIALQPVLNQLSSLASNKGLQTLVNVGIDAIGILANTLGTVLNVVGDVVSAISTGWSVIEPIAVTAAAAIGVLTAATVAYKVAQVASNVVTGISTALENVHMAAIWLQSDATFAATASQWGFNAALLACPVTWIIGGIMLAIGALYTVVAVINKVTGSTISATGIIGGAIYTIAAVIYNIGAAIYNFVVVTVIQNIVNAIAWAVANAKTIISNVGAFIYNTAATVAEFVVNTFNTAVYNVKVAFASIATAALSSFRPIASGAATVASTIANSFIAGANKAIQGVNWIIDAVNKIPGVNLSRASEIGEMNLDFTSGIDDKLSSLSNITSASAPSKVSFGRESYQSYSDTAKVMDLNSANYKSLSDAYSKGYKSGKDLASQISNFFKSTTGKTPSKSDLADLAKKYGSAAKNAAKTGKKSKKSGKDKSAKKTAKNTDDIKKALNLSNENLKYIRDIASQTIVNRYTNANIKVSMTNNNNLSSDADIDGITKKLTGRIQTELSKAAKGAY